MSLSSLSRICRPHEPTFVLAPTCRAVCEKTLLAVSAWLHCSKPHSLEVVSQHSLDLAHPFQRRFHGKFAAHLQDETQPESLEADGVKASRHERRVAQAMTFCFRHSDEPGVHWLASSVRATANGEAPAKISSTFIKASLLSFAGIASQGTVSRL